MRRRRGSWVWVRVWVWVCLASRSANATCSNQSSAAPNWCVRETWAAGAAQTRLTYLNTFGGVAAREPGAVRAIKVGVGVCRLGSLRLPDAPSPEACLARARASAGCAEKTVVSFGKPGGPDQGRCACDTFIGCDPSDAPFLTIKSANLSSAPEARDGTGDAGRLFDGRSGDGIMLGSAGSCARTGTSQPAPFWMRLEIEASGRKVAYLRLVGRTQHGRGQQDGVGWTVHVGDRGDVDDPVCATAGDASAGLREKIACATPLAGKYVTIRRYARQRCCRALLALVLCLLHLRLAGAACLLIAAPLVLFSSATWMVLCEAQVFGAVSTESSAPAPSFDRFAAAGTGAGVAFDLVADTGRGGRRALAVHLCPDGG